MSKKLWGILMTCVLIISTLYIPKAGLEAAATLIYEDFETGLNGWSPRGTDDTAEIVDLSTEEAYSGIQSLKVSNRTQTWHGAMCDMTSELSLGVTYTFSVMVKYTGNSYSGNHNFSLQLQYSDGVSDQYKNIKSTSVSKGQWTKMVGEYTMPTDASDIHLYVETEYKSSPSTSDFMTFYIDDFTATPADLPDIETDIPSLKDVYATYFRIGGAATAGELAPAPAKDLFLKHYDVLTIGNELKPDAVLDRDATIAYMEENDGNQINPQVNIRSARTLLEFARDYNIPVRGHTLVWHNQTPDWFFKENYSTDSNAAWVTKDVMLQRMENYIKNVMELIAKTYPTVEFYAWDVVNEAIDPNTSTGYRNPGSNNVTSGNSPWMQTIGSDFIEKAFEYARKYAPVGCKLYYNDYNEYEDRKCTFIYNLLVKLKQKDLVDGMGMQSHWTMDYPSLSMFEASARKYDSLGLEIQLTELDIKQPNNDAGSLTAQASRYKQLLNKVASLRKEGININAVIFWGITDTTSWLGGYPLLFNGEYKAKPAFYSIVADVPPLSEVPTPTPRPTSSPTITPTPTSGPSITPIPTTTPTPSPTGVPTPTVFPTPIPTTVPGQNGTPIVTVDTKNNGSYISQNYKVNVEGGAIDLSKLTIEFTASNMPNEVQNIWVDHAALQLLSAPWYTPLTNAVSGTFTDSRLNLSIDKTTTLTEGDGTFTIELRFAKMDWSTYPALSNPIVKVYYKGSLVQ